MSGQTPNKQDIMTQTEEIENIIEGPIVEWSQDRWWLEGKTRIKKEKKFYQTTKGVVLLVIGVLLVTLIIAAIISMNQAGEGVIHEPVTDDTVFEPEHSSLQEHIKRLRFQLEKADPTIRETPPPHVMMDIVIQLE